MILSNGKACSINACCFSWLYKYHFHKHLRTQNEHFQEKYSGTGLIDFTFLAFSIKMFCYHINFHLSEQQQYAAVSVCISLVADFFISGQELFPCYYIELKMY